MAFHEINLDDGIAYGAQGGPGFRTQIQTLDSGAEERISRWTTPRRTYDISYGIKDHSDVAAIIEFFIGRQGAAHGFRFKDFHDCSTATTHVDEVLGGAAPAYDDQEFGVGDGVTLQFQLTKQYVSGIAIRNRTITKPRSGTFTIGMNGTLKTEGVHYTINYSSGIVTFATAPAPLAVLTWGGKFDVPVRFAEEVDQNLLAQITGPGDSEIPNIKLHELVDEVMAEEEFFYGGGKVISMTANTSITCLDGRAIALTAVSAGLKLILPDATNLASGGPYFYLANEGVNNIGVYYHGGSVLAFNLPAGQMSTVVLIEGTWYEGH